MYFLFLAIQAHDLVAVDDMYMDFFDNHGAPINHGDLFGIIGQKINCGCFYIEIKITGNLKKSITAEVSYNNLKYLYQYEYWIESNF